MCLPAPCQALLRMTVVQPASALAYLVTPVTNTMKAGALGQDRPGQQNPYGTLAREVRSDRGSRMQNERHNTKRRRVGWIAEVQACRNKNFAEQGAARGAVHQKSARASPQGPFKPQQRHPGSNPSMDRAHAATSTSMAARQKGVQTSPNCLLYIPTRATTQLALNVQRRARPVP